MGYYGALFGKTFYVFGLAAEERFGYEKGEIGVLHTGSLEHLVKCVLHLLPDGIAIGLYNHTSAHSRLLCEVCLHYEFIVPARIILAALGEIFEFCHYIIVMFLLILMIPTKLTKNPRILQHNESAQSFSCMICFPGWSRYM